MDAGKRPPESFGDVKKRLFRRTWVWLSPKSLGFKIVSGVIILIALLALARIKVLGDKSHKYTKLIFPVDIPGIDEKEPVISLMLSFEVEDDKEQRHHIEDQLYFS